MPQIGIKTQGAICFVDDEEGFIDAMKLMFARQYHVECYTQPQLALGRLRADNQYLINEERNLSDIASDEDFNRRLRRALRWLLDTRRHSVIQTCFADFSMPAITGVNLLSQIESSRMQRVLLTGQAETIDAVNAFNAGAIDAYMPKQTDKLGNKLRILALKGARRKLDGIWRALDKDIQQAFEQKATRMAVQQRLDAMESIEYFLLPQPAGYLCRCKNGEIRWLQLETHTSQVGAVEILRDVGMSNGELEELKLGERTAAIELGHAMPGLKVGQFFPLSKLEVVSQMPWVGMAEFALPRPIVDAFLEGDDDIDG